MKVDRLPPQFKDEESAEKAVVSLNNRWYNGLPIHAELSPVTDFREACCRQYEMGYATHTHCLQWHEACFQALWGRTERSESISRGLLGGRGSC